jgi:hypothetical protein
MDKICQSELTNHIHDTALERTDFAHELLQKLDVPSLSAAVLKAEQRLLSKNNASIKEALFL